MTLYGDKTLEELEALANAATEGPWILDFTRISAYLLPPQGHYVATMPIPYEAWRDRVLTDKCAAARNGRFIAASRAAIPALIAEIHRLSKMIEDGCGIDPDNMGHMEDGDKTP
jgi:hypothetical protein